MDFPLERRGHVERCWPYWIALLAALLCFPPHLRGQSIFNTPPDIAEQFLLTSANQERATRGLHPLRLDSTLTTAAAEHARQMAAHAAISHQFPGEPKLSVRAANAGARFNLISENVAQAPVAAMIHDLWMHSEGHRENLLDPGVNAVGIAVVKRGDEYYAVEDFANTIQPLSFSAQETAVAGLLAKSGMEIATGKVMTEQDARRTCNMSTGYAGARAPWYIMRYTAHSISALPAQLQSRLSSGRYHQAFVGACAESSSTPCTAYNIAVLLYP